LFPYWICKQQGLFCSQHGNQETKLVFSYDKWGENSLLVAILDVWLPPNFIHILIIGNILTQYEKTYYAVVFNRQNWHFFHPKWSGGQQDFFFHLYQLGLWGKKGLWKWQQQLNHSIPCIHSHRRYNKINWLIKMYVCTHLESQKQSTKYDEFDINRETSLISKAWLVAHQLNAQYHYYGNMVWFYFRANMEHVGYMLCDLVHANYLKLFVRSPVKHNTWHCMLNTLVILEK
jgi:hypothetical protein